MFKELFESGGTGRYKGLDYEFKRGYVYIYGERTGKPIIKQKAPANATTKLAEEIIDNYLKNR